MTSIMEEFNSIEKNNFDEYEYANDTVMDVELNSQKKLLIL